MAPDQLPTSLVGSYSQPDWLIDRGLLAAGMPPRVRRESSGASPGLARRGPGRCDGAADPGTGARGRRHRHRWRDAAGELLEPLRHRARQGWTSTTRAPRSTAAARSNPCRVWSGRSSAAHPVQARDVGFLRANTTPGQDDGARDRSPWRSRRRTTTTRARRDGAGLRRCRERGDRRPVRGRRRHRAARRALHAGAAREGARVRARRARRARWTAHAGTTAVHICFGYAAIIHERPPATRSWPSSAGRGANRSRSRPRSPASTVGARGAARQDHHPRRVRPRRHGEVETPRRWRRGSGARFPTRARTARRRPRLRHEVPAAARSRSASSQSMVSGARLVRESVSGDR